MKKQKRKPKILRRVLLILLIRFAYSRYGKPVEINQKVEIKQGDSFYSFLSGLSSQDVLRMKLFVKFSKPDLSKLEQGVFVFSGEYEKQEFIDIILEGPAREFVNYTVLEGWSIYDVDYNLTQKGYISEGEYLAFVSSQSFLDEQRQKYDFLQKVDASDLTDLEGFLYPDTYKIDLSQNFLDQLITLQLQTFDKKVWKNLADDFSNFQENIQSDYGLELDWYDAVILSTVVEKEERNVKNKPTVAGIFLNRLAKGMRLDADITLCYGLKEPYETCTPEVIVQGIYDEKNVFNTRKQAGIPPHAIANPSAESLEAVLNYKKTDYIYYLHDAEGGIHYGKTSAEHSANKEKYL